MPKKTLEPLVVAQNKSKSSMKYRAEAAAMSEGIKKLQAEQAAARAAALPGGGRVVRQRLA